MHYCSFKIFKTFIFQRSVLNIGSCSSLYDSWLLLRSGLYSGMCPDTRKMDAFPSSPSLGNILGNYSGKSKKGLGGKELKINLGCHQVYPW